LHGVRGEFTDNVSEIAVGPIFTGHELEHKWAKKWGAALYRDGVGVGSLGVVQGWPMWLKEDFQLVKVCLRRNRFPWKVADALGVCRCEGGQLDGSMERNSAVSMSTGSAFNFRAIILSLHTILTTLLIILYAPLLPHLFQPVHLRNNQVQLCFKNYPWLLY
jgi:hypothetical protein